MTALVVLGGVYVLLTRTWVTRWILAERVGAMLNATVSSSSAVVRTDGTLVVENAVVRAPGVRGQAGNVLEIKRLEIEPDWGSILSGGTRLRRVDIDEPVIRVSQAIDDGSLNVAGLRVPETKTDIAQPPVVRVRGGAIEIGEHKIDGSLYTVLRRVDVAGSVTRSRDDTGDSIVSFRQIDASPGTKPLMEIQGRVGKRGLALSLDGIEFSQWPLSSVPTPLRQAFRELDLDGRIGRTIFTYAPDGTVEATIALIDVALNLPIEAEPAEDAEGNTIPLPPDQLGRKLRMEKVNGTLRVRNDGIDGDLTGMLEELPYQVRLELGAASTIAPFVVELSCRDFEMKRNSQIMRFASGLAQRRMAQFGNPTGIVDAYIRAVRGAPVADTPGEISISGIVRLKDGTAAFERFPYTFEHMRGEWRFDDSEIRIVKLEGVAPSGAHITASGLIAPPTGEAGVEIDVLVNDLPVDKALESALGKRKQIIDALFNRGRYDELVREGLVLSDESRRDLRMRLFSLEQGVTPDTPDEPDQLRARLDKPVFRLGGKADVAVRVTRDVGNQGEWNDEIAIHLASAGLLPERFAYPLLASDVTILKRNDDATVSGGSYAGLRGGTATISASLNLARLDEPGAVFAPEISLSAHEAPLDELLVHAVPDTGGQLSPRTMLERLGVAGRITDAQVRLGLSPRNTVGYDIALAVRDATAAPSGPGGERTVSAVGASGNVRVTESTVQVDLAGSLRGAPGAIECPVSVRASVDYAERADAPATDRPHDRPGDRLDPPSGDLHADIALHGLDTSLRVEDFVSVFNTTAAETLAALRDERRPSGTVDLAVTLSRTGGKPLETRVTAEHPRVEFAGGGARWRIEEPAGSVTLETREGISPSIVRFADFSASVSLDAQPAGRLHLHGTANTVGGPVEQRPLAVRLSDGRFESKLTALAVERLGGSLAEAFRTYGLRGAFDMDLVLVPRASSNKARTADPAWDASGSVTPRDLALRVGEMDIPFRAIAGTIDLTPGGGRLHDLAVATDAWSARADGTWITRDDAVALEARISGQSEGLPSDLVALLPRQLSEILADLKLRASGPVMLSSGQLSVTLPAGVAAPPAVSTTGRLEFAGAALDAGVEITDASAVMDYRFARPDPTRPPDFELKIVLPQARAMGVQLQNGRTRIASGQGGEVLIPLISADCHGGRIAGSVTLAPPAPGHAREFEGEFRASDVRFASLLADLRGRSSPETPVMPGPQRPPAQPGDVPPPDAPARDTTTPAGAPGALEIAAPDESRGRLDAELSLAGELGKASSRRGRGTATVGGERILNVPVLVALIRLSNLQLPMNERLDYARAAFYIRGTRISLEEILLRSRSVGFFGYGTADLPDLALDLRFRARNNLRIPVVSAIVEGIRNELFTAEVRGTPAKPDVRLVTLTGTTRLLKSAVGTSQDEQSRQLDEIEAQTREQRQAGESAPRGRPAPLPPR